ncbi:hypothetical protein [Azospirillum griseum]|uniref:hypothetical protein n=1 Tax=Azospirillum griseum TaxID=2496639 RepID=UPI001FE40DCB|nr:hypothetical protein [Azospirillum griseum]
MCGSDDRASRVGLLRRGVGVLATVLTSVLVATPALSWAGMMDRTEPGHMPPVVPGQDLPIAPPVVQFPMPPQWVTIRSNQEWRKVGKFEKDLSKDCAARRFRELSPLRFRAYFKGEVVGVAFGHGLNLYDPQKKADRKLIYLFRDGDSTACTIQTITNEDVRVMNEAQAPQTGGSYKPVSPGGGADNTNGARNTQPGGNYKPN